MRILRCLAAVVGLLLLGVSLFMLVGISHFFWRNGCWRLESLEVVGWNVDLWLKPSHRERGDGVLFPWWPPILSAALLLFAFARFRRPHRGSSG